MSLLVLFCLAKPFWYPLRIAITDSPKLQQLQKTGISDLQDDETESFSPEYTWKTDFCLFN